MFFKLKGKGITRALVTVLLVGAIVASFCLTVFGAQTVRIGRTTTKIDYVNVRSGPGQSHSQITSIPPQTEMKVLGEADGNDNYKWYLVVYNGYTGYVRSDFVEILREETVPETTAPETTSPETTGGETTGIPGETTGIPGETTGGEGETTGGSDETTGIPGETTAPEGGTQEPQPIDFEEYLEQQKFPESYKVYLRELHALYPNWVFKAQHVEYDFEFSVDKQMGVSLVENSFPSSWKSVEGDAYNWESNTWKIFDGDRWVRASRDIIRHYMDPRNFLGANSIFQFLDQSYDPNVQDIEGVKRIIAGTFMENDVIDADGRNLNYAQAIFDAGVKYKVNPYVLSSMIIIEVGSQGSSIISGNVAGYVGYYNYFNIGAYNDGIRDAVSRGLWYAKGGNNGSTTYSRPWNTRLKAINGGADFYSAGYLTAGQNTLYLKRFNVQGDKPFTHQYMTSVYGPAVEATKLAKGYTEELRTTPLSFYIPVYRGMPETPCAAPTLDGSPNMKLSSLSVTGYELTPGFDTEVLEYMLVVPPTTGASTVNAVPMEQTAKIEGAGALTVNVGTNVYEIKVTAGNGTVRIYKLTVARENIENFGDLTFTDKYIPKNNVVHGISPNMTVGDFRAAFVSTGLVTVQSAAGAQKTDSDLIATGDLITVSSTNAVKYADYTASVKGDLNSDGTINISDLLKVRNRILGSDEFSETQTLSGDIDGNGSVNISDLLKIRNHILGTAAIS